MKIEKITIKNPIDENPDLSFLGEYGDTDKPGAIDREERGDRTRGQYRYFYPATEYAEQDYARMEAGERGEWDMVGVEVCATVNNNGRLHTITSSGLWGIESDSDSTYFRDVAADELADLTTELAAFGVDLSNFDELAAVAFSKL